MIEEWLDSIGITNSELDILRNPNEINVPISKNNILKNIKSQLSKEQVISFDDCATNIIDRLFKEYVTDDTLVITTHSEHPSVVKNLKRCKNVKYIADRDNFYPLTDISGYKFIFVYLIGISMGDNYFTPNETCVKIKHCLQMNNIPHVFVLDAVQELFLLPRDYSMFDYVIGTAHALIPKYNRGIVISKEKPYCKELNDEKLSNFIDIIYKYKEKMSIFNYMMLQDFGLFIAQDKNLIANNNSPYIFNLMDKKKRFRYINDKQFTDEEFKDMDNTPATFRAFPALIEREKFLTNMKKTKYILNQYLIS